MRVPRPVAVSPEIVAGGPAALLIEHIDGVIIGRELPPAYPSAATASVGYALTDALVDLHALPWRELGLADIGHPDRFLNRQVRRWQWQFDAYRHRDVEGFDLLAPWLEEHRPAEIEPAILHGGLHVGKCVFSATPPPQLLGIVGWHMSTIGDPLLDLGLLLALWGSERPTPRAIPHVQAFSRAPGAPSRADLAERYALGSGRSLEHLTYYMVLALWKLAALMEGASLHRAAERAGAEDGDQRVEGGEEVQLILNEARAIARG